MKLLFFFIMMIISENVLIKAWKTRPNGKQIFSLDDEEGDFIWDIENNIWEFKYKTFSFIIKESKIFKVENEKIQVYPCIGIAEIFSIKFSDWDKIKVEKEIIQGNFCTTFLKYKNFSLIIQFQIHPFALKFIGFYDLYGYHIINFR